MIAPSSSPPPRPIRRPGLAALLFAVAAGCALVVVLRIVTEDRIGGLLPANGTRIALLVGTAAAVGAGFAHTGWRRSRREWLGLLARTALAGTSLALSLLVAEIGTRLFFASSLSGNTIERLRAYEAGEPVPVRGRHPLAEVIQLSPNPRLVYEPRPGLDRIFGDKPLRTNAAGMREDRDYPLEAPSGTVRIVGVGDSGMWGWGLDQELDYLSVLENRLAARNDGFRYEVLNLAVPGYNTSQEVESLRSKGLRFDPDVVVVGWCENDFDLPFFMLRKGVFRRLDTSFLYHLAFRRRDLAELFRPSAGDLRTSDADDVASHLVAASGKEGVDRAFRELRALRDRHGFRVLVFGPMGEKTARMIRKTGLDVYDTRAEIPRRTYPTEWGIHFMHPRRKGHEALAKHLEEALDARGWLKPAPRAR